MRIKSVLAALGIGLAMVLSLDYVSFAATGHSLILGHGNTANSRTVLTRTTAGTTLQLNSRRGLALADGQPDREGLAPQRRPASTASTPPSWHGARAPAERVRRPARLPRPNVSGRS